MWVLHSHTFSYLIISITLWEKYNYAHFYTCGSTIFEKWNNLSKTIQKIQDRIGFETSSVLGFESQLVWLLTTFYYFSFSSKVFFHFCLDWKKNCSCINVNITTSMSSLKLLLKLQICFILTILFLHFLVLQSHETPNQFISAFLFSVWGFL